jgi:preprotein translocase subunit SecG
MKTTLLIIQIVLSILITTSILLQSQGTGLSASFGGSNTSYHTRRGLEKVIFYFTIASIVLFMLISIAVLQV